MEEEEGVEAEAKKDRSSEGHEMEGAEASAWGFPLICIVSCSVKLLFYDFMC